MSKVTQLEEEIYFARREVEEFKAELEESKRRVDGWRL